METVLFSTLYKGIIAAASISLGIATILFNQLILGLMLIVIGIYLFSWSCALPKKDGKGISGQGETGR
jgi:hypothetical protein